MIGRRNHQQNQSNSRRNLGACCAFVALAAGLLCMGTGCNEDEAWDAFRSAATSNVETGVNSLMDGVLDGIFAAANLGVDSSSDSTTSGS